MQRADLGAHLDAQLGVEIGKRLVEQKHLRLADDGAAHGDALALATGKFARLAVEQFIEAEDFRRLGNLLGDFGVGGFAQGEVERHVVAHRHVRV